MGAVWQALGVLKAILQHHLFTGAALLVLSWAVAGEISSLRRYQRSESRVTQAAIEYLEAVEKKEKAIVLKHRDVHQHLGEKLGGQVWNWLKEHLLGRSDSTGEAYEAQVQENRFVLLRYPNFLVRSTPRSSLSFVPALLTGIGLIGTFFGITSSLSKFDLNAIADRPILKPWRQMAAPPQKYAYLILASGSWSSSFAGQVVRLASLIAMLKSKSYFSVLTSQSSGFAVLVVSVTIISFFGSFTVKSGSKTKGSNQTQVHRFPEFLQRRRSESGSGNLNSGSRKLQSLNTKQENLGMTGLRTNSLSF